MKILVYGNSGSGKSTYAQALAAQHCLSHLDLDSIVWEPGMIAVQRDPQLIANSLMDFFSTHHLWVIKGCYGELVESATAYCTQLVSSTLAEMLVLQTISGALGSLTNTPRWNNRTPC